jgi:hypothetical protein
LPKAHFVTGAIALLWSELDGRALDSISVNASDSVVLLIDNEEVVVIESHARGFIQAGVGCRPAVTTKDDSAIACNGINSPPRVDLSDALVAGISNKQATAGVYGNSNGLLKQAP